MTTEQPKIEIWGIDQILPYGKNAKIHSQEQVETLAKLIDTHGWTQPIVVDKDGVIIAGHGRRLAAIHLGRLKVPVVCRRDLSKAQADALRLADNRVASTSYDITLEQEEIQRLAEEIDVSILGYSEKDLAFLTEDMAEIDMGAFVEDVGEAVEQQKVENTAKAAATDEAETTLGDAFGFKKVSVAQARRIKAFMRECESDTGAKGAEALMSYFDQLDIAVSA